MSNFNDRLALVKREGVEIKTLRHGQRFECISEHRWTYERGGDNGQICWATRDDGHHDCFCATAKVILLEKAS